MRNEVETGWRERENWQWSRGRSLLWGETSLAYPSGGFHDHHSPSLSGGTDLRTATTGGAPLGLRKRFSSPTICARMDCSRPWRGRCIWSVAGLAAMRPLTFSPSCSATPLVANARSKPISSDSRPLPLPRPPRAARAHRRLARDERLGRNACASRQLATVHVAGVSPALLAVLSEQGETKLC
jgi:hypothetical protein